MIPPIYEQAFKKDKALKAAFEKFTPGRQREFVEYVNEPKLEETKVKRFEKTVPMIKKGVGLNDKYR